MLKLPIPDFVEEIKSELLGFTDIDEEKVIEWEQEFYKWLNRPGAKKSIKNEKFFCLRDESELFEIADSYVIAVDNKEEKMYWDKFE